MESIHGAFIRASLTDLFVVSACELPDFLCSDDKTCVAEEDKCDMVDDCPDGGDEMFPPCGEELNEIDGRACERRSGIFTLFHVPVTGTVAKHA